MAVEGAAKIIKVLLFVFNFIFFLGGIGLLGVGIYVQLKIGDYVALSSVKYVTGSIIIIAVGAIIAVIAFFGCCGSIKESRCLLGTFFALMLLVFGLEVAGTSLGFVYRDQVKDELKKDLNQTLYQYGSDDKKGVTEAYDLLQEKEKCCGVYGYKDWQKTPFTRGNHSIVPDSCCKEVKQGCGDISADTEKINIGGCYDKTLDLLRGNLLIIFGLGVAVAVIQVNWLYALFFFCEVTKNPNITAGKEDGNSKQSNGELVDEPCNTCLIDNSNDVSSSEGGWNIFSLTHVNAHNRVFV